MKVNYIRVSSGTQNCDVQVFNLSSEYKVCKDICSGSIAFSDRTEGAKIIQLVKEGKVEEILIHDISRIGRNNLDVLNMIQFFTVNNVNLVSRREGLSTMIEGKPNPIASLMVGLLSTLAEYELERLRERRNEGIAKAKDRGVYANHGGNRRIETREEFLSKSDTKKIIKYLAEGNSLRRTALLAQSSLGKVQKVVRMTEGLDRMTEAITTPEPKAKKIATQLLSDRAKAIDLTKITMREWIYLPKNLHMHNSDQAREKFLEEDEARTIEGEELEAQRKANL
jgi:DNA invertase Pin-like site-specific DNA recombinase